MESSQHPKWLIIDKSAWDPFSWSISENYLSAREITEFLEEVEVIPLVSSTAVREGEFTQHSYLPNLFSGKTYFNNETLEVDISERDQLCLGETDGSLTPSAISPNGIPIGTWHVEEDYRSLSMRIILPGLVFKNRPITSACKNSTTAFSFQRVLWEASDYWQKLSKADRSIIEMQRISDEYFPEIRIASLVNDYHLRRQHELEGFEMYGSVSMLAGMVLKEKKYLSKATSLYYKWEKRDKKWIPKNFSREVLPFREVLRIEKERFRNKTSFWL